MNDSFAYFLEIIK